MRAERENGIADHFLDHVADHRACSLFAVCDCIHFKRVMDTPTLCFQSVFGTTSGKQSKKCKERVAVFFLNRYTRTDGALLGKNLVSAHAVAHLTRGV